uniref:Uncharacterized protein n=1 Tax=Tanacetum cinerariifolium TaxID=118510 RepID=A0A6L2K363_TANCI|nr:hypothetical protein [Tanacetum cinerariifolium]
MGEFGLSVHRSGGSICSGVVRRGVAQSALPEGKREWLFLLPSVETKIEDWAFSLFYREAMGVNSISSSSPCKGVIQMDQEKIRRTNAAGGVQNRPAKDGRVHVVEPRAREALKKKGGDERLYSKSMPELESAKMIIDAGSSDNIAST